MAGGNGGRFWPVSRESTPKPFLDIFGNGYSFLRITYERFLKIVPPENILVITDARFAGLVKGQIPELPKQNLLLEPFSRGTAPCLAYSMYSILKRDPDAMMVTTPADHFITDEDLFRTTIDDVLDFAEKEPALVTLGIRPTRPDTNYGYIQASGGKKARESGGPIKIRTFTEKPSQELAEVFCKSGEFYWNSGIFACKASVICDEMERLAPEVSSFFKGWEDAFGSDSEEAFLQKVYSEIPKISIDYAVMEKTDKSWIYPCSFGWADVDTWKALYDNYRNKDASGNVVVAPQSLPLDGQGNLIISSFARSGKKVYAIKGLENFMVIDTKDALLICPKDDKQYNDLVSGLGMPEFSEFR